MDDKSLRQTVSASSAGILTTMPPSECTLGVQTGPIIVRQVIGEQEEQKVLDIHVVVPDPKPAIEQIIDVFVKDVEINSVDVITDKVIVRGDLEVKAIYVADTVDQPVLAIEIKNFKWTQDIALPGARKGMDADASVVVEFVDFDVEHHTHAYRHKYGMPKYNNVDEDICDDENVCEDVCEDTCEDHHHHRRCREFDVSIVLKIIAKVMADREIQLGMGTMPVTPKG